MDYKIELKSLKVYESMSEETTCFQGNLYIDGKLVGYCKNDGRGGSTNIHGNSLEDNKLIQKVDEWCKKQQIRHTDNTIEWDSLEDRIDELVYEFQLKKDKEKFVKKMNKSMLTNLVFTKQSEDEELNSYSVLGWKGHTIEKMLGNPKGREVIKGTISDNIKKGYRLLSTNIPEELLK